ncbi:MAG: HIT family protein [Hyphomonadaceae bacterium]|nr:HIT family protein [Hyphomonadaceae bacterium]
MSLHGAYDDANIFAKILRGEAPCFKVYEDDVALAFMDIFPVSRGHTLVIPKRAAARNLLELPTDEVGPYMTRVQRVAQGVERALTPDGVSIFQFNGAPAGQTVFHLHFHIVPRWEGVAMGQHGKTPMADKETLAQLAKDIGAAV